MSSSSDSQRVLPESLIVKGEEVSLIQPGLLAPEEFMSSRFELAPGIYFGAVPEWCRNPGAFEKLLGDRAKILRSAVFGVSAVYEYDRLVTDGAMSKGVAMNGVQMRLRDAHLCMWLAKPTSYQVPFIARGEAEDGADLTFAGGEETPRLILRSGSEFHSSLEEEDLLLTKELLPFVLELPTGGALRQALNFLYKSALENLFENVYVFQWVALEALFSSASPIEATYRLKQRIALFCARNEAEAAALFRDVAKWYDIRSDIVHGRPLSAMKPKDRERLFSYGYATEELLRASLLRIVRDSALRATFSGGDRDRWLESLWRTGRVWPDAPADASTDESPTSP